MEDRLRFLRGEEGVKVGESGQLRVQGVLLIQLQTEPLPSPEQGTVLEHGDGLGVKGPICALPGAVMTPRDLDEAVVEAKVVSERILPSLRVLPVVGEVVHDELVYVGERKHLLRRPHQSHGGERDVGVWRFAVSVRFSAGTRHGGIVGLLRSHEFGD